MLTALLFDDVNGTMMSEYFIVGLIKSSYAGLTNLLYCFNTSTIVLPRSEMSRDILRESLISSGVSTNILRSISLRNLSSLKA
jgi:hypothetical protein